jgi:transcriptional regulator with XRE-family HTH domain
MELPNLRHIRRRRLLTQSELADLSGLTTASISRIETGDTKARISTVRKICVALGVTVDDLTRMDPISGTDRKGDKK